MKINSNVHTYWFWAGILSIGMLTSCGQQTETQVVITDQSHERIVYSSFRPAGWNLYYYEYPGDEPVQLTDHPSLDYEAAFSPDGRYVVFTSERLGNPSLFTLDLENGGEPQLLIRSDAMEDQAVISPDGEWVAFVSTTGGNADIYKLPFRPDTTLDISEAVNLTQHSSGNFRPAFSPDGEWIAFSSDRHTPPFVHRQFPFVQQRAGDIHLMSAEGGEAIRLTQTDLWDGSPAWSPDGEMIYFYSERESPDEFRLWTMDRDGSNQRPISFAKDIFALSPAVLSENQIAFTTVDGPPIDRRSRIVSLDFQRGDTLTISDPAIICLSPAIHSNKTSMICHGGPPQERSAAVFPGPLLVAGSPEIRHLPDRNLEIYGVRHAFAAPPHPFKNELVVRSGALDLIHTAIDGSNSTDLLNAEVFNESNPGDQIFNMRWTPDGEHIVFTVGPFFGGLDSEANIWKMPADGSNLTNLTPDSPYNDGFAEFGPDDRMIFRSSRSGTFDIYMLDDLAGEVRNLTNHPAKDVFPAFSPLGNQIAFASDRDSSMHYPGGVATVDIYTLDLNPDGSTGELRRITQTRAQNAHVQYSPDGEWVIYTSGRHGINDEEPLVQSVIFAPQMYGDIYAYRLSDGQTVRLTHSKWENGAPLWAGPVHSKSKE